MPGALQLPESLGLDWKLSEKNKMILWILEKAKKCIYLKYLKIYKFVQLYKYLFYKCWFIQTWYKSISKSIILL